MEESNICLTKLKNGNKNKHYQSKKHKYSSNLIIKNFIVRNPKSDTFKDIVQSYNDKHKRKFDNFTVCVIRMKNGLIVNTISVPSIITREKPHLFKPSMIELPIVIRVSPLEFVDTFIRNINNEVDEINIIFISDLKDLTFSHYIAQPKSMPCRKQVRNFIEKDFGDFDYNRLPNCFRHINTLFFSIKMEMKSVSDCLNIVDDAIVENIGKYNGTSVLENAHKNLLEKGQSDFIEDRVALSIVLSQINSILEN